MELFFMNISFCVIKDITSPAVFAVELIIVVVILAFDDLFMPIKH